MLFHRRQSATTAHLLALPLLIVLAATPEAVAQGTRLLRDPDVGPEHIAFVHANDIWLVSRDGGDALRLTSYENKRRYTRNASVGVCGIRGILGVWLGGRS